MLQLRDYQRASLDALYDYWAADGGNPLIVLPTGAGKALVIAALIRELIERYPTLRICMVTHQRELIRQNADELKSYWPGAPIGIYSAGLNRRDKRAQILFCGIQSVHERARELGAFDLVVVDEAHLIPRSADTSYGRFLAGLKELYADVRVVGLTATPYRLDSGSLLEGEGALFSEVVYEANVGDLIRDEYLSPLVNRYTALGLDTRNVGRRGGDFIASELADAVDQEHISRAAVEEIVRAGADRRAWLAFCCSVEHAHHVRDFIREAGVTCEAVTGKTPGPVRDRLLADFKSGRIRCLTSVGVLTTGFNNPMVDLIALLRPTQSPGLYVQMVGRALRKAEGKADALILDFARLIRTHGPIDAIVPKAPGRGAAPTKHCQECAAEFPMSLMTCPYCAHVQTRTCVMCETVYPACDPECPTCGHGARMPRQITHELAPDEGVSILSTMAPEWLTVTDWSAKRHRKEGKPDSLKVTYRCGKLTFVSVWVCLEHGGYARAKAEKWWREHAAWSGQERAVPTSVDDALDAFDFVLEQPHEILVRPSGKFQEVIGYRHAEPPLAMAAE